ncbi:MAG: RidA family protein [Chloroflexi bacterium]|nr:RidA family protein [Chloroflexota bacterium]
MPIERHNPDSVYKPGPYSQAVTVTGGRLLLLAGQVAVDAEGGFVGVGDLRAQTTQALENIKAILASFDADFSHVVKLTMYIVNYHPDKLPLIIDVLGTYIDMSSPPANTVLGVQSLARSEFLIEIEAIAALD